jgi:hypothetical protein
MAILCLTLFAAIHTKLQGIIITGTAIAVFIVAMSLIPRFRKEQPPLSSPQAKTV